MVTLWIHVTDAAIDLKRASTNKKKIGQKKTVLVLQSYIAKKNVSLVHVPGRKFFEKLFVRKSTFHRWRRSTKQYLGNTWPHYEKEQIQRPGTIFPNLSDKVAVLRGRENGCLFATL